MQKMKYFHSVVTYMIVMLAIGNVNITTAMQELFKEIPDQITPEFVRNTSAYTLSGLLIDNVSRQKFTPEAKRAAFSKTTSFFRTAVDKNEEDIEKYRKLVQSSPTQEHKDAYNFAKNELQANTKLLIKLLETQRNDLSKSHAPSSELEPINDELKHLKSTTDNTIMTASLIAAGVAALAGTAALVYNKLTKKPKDKSDQKSKKQ